MSEIYEREEWENEETSLWNGLEWLLGLFVISLFIVVITGVGSCLLLFYGE